MQGCKARVFGKSVAISPKVFCNNFGCGQPNWTKLENVTAIPLIFKFATSRALLWQRPETMNTTPPVFDFRTVFISREIFGL